MMLDHPSITRNLKHKLRNVFSEHRTTFYVKQVEYWKEALAELPVEVGHLVAHGNAEHLWHIAPRN
jgi:hypothetical protein